MTNTPMLKSIIKDSGIKKKALCDALNCTYSTLRAKVNGRTEFTAEEMFRLCDALNMTGTTMRKIFFAHEVELNSTEGDDHDAG